MERMKWALILTMAIALAACSKKEEPVPPMSGQEQAVGEGEQEGQEGQEEQEEAAQEAPEKATLGALAPAFEAKDQDGEEHSLEGYRGKTVVLEWINPECPYVQRHHEAKTMTTLAKRFADQDVVWLGIDSSNFVKPEDSKAFQEKYEVDYPVLQDASGEIGRRYEARTTPHIYIIDAEGILRYRGAIDDDPRGSAEEVKNYAEAALTSLLAGEEIAEPETEPYGCTVKYEGS